MGGGGDHGGRAGGDPHVRRSTTVGVEEDEVARLDLRAADRRALPVLRVAARAQRDARGTERVGGQA